MNKHFEAILFSIKIIVGVCAVIVVFYSLSFMFFLFSPFSHHIQIEYNEYLYFKAIAICTLSAVIILCLTGNLNKPLCLLAVPVMYLSVIIVEIIQVDDSDLMIKIGAIFISGIMTSMYIDSYYSKKVFQEEAPSK